MRVISHDGFARESVVRENVSVGFQSCKWCGMRARYRYGTQTDQLSGLIDWWPGVFCTIGCARSYHS